MGKEIAPFLLNLCFFGFFVLLHGFDNNWLVFFGFHRVLKGVCHWDLCMYTVSGSPPISLSLRDRERAERERKRGAGSDSSCAA